MTNKEAKYIDWVWEYLSGDLDLAGEREFLNEVEHNPALASVYREQLSIYEHLKKTDVIQLRRQLARISARRSHSSFHWLFRDKRILLAAASVIILIALAFIFLYLNRATNKPEDKSFVEGAIRIIPESEMTSDSVNSATEKSDLVCVMDAYHFDSLLSSVINPESYKPVESFEKLLDFNRRSNGIHIIYPKPDQWYHDNEPVLIKWKASVVSKHELTILNNKLDTVIHVQHVSNDHRLNILLGDGLYYWVLSDINGTSHTGRFFQTR